MSYLPTLHAYLHQSSLLLQAYPTTRITTKYSLPRKTKPRSGHASSNSTTTTTVTTKEKRDPAATLTLKTFHPESGICLKYRTDKAAEVSRLMAGLGRLAKGELIEMPSAGAGATDGEKMDVDEVVPTTTTAVEATQPQTQTQQGGGGKKKKKGGKK